MNCLFYVVMHLDVVPLLKTTSFQQIDTYQECFVKISSKKFMYLFVKLRKQVTTF